MQTWQLETAIFDYRMTIASIDTFTDEVLAQCLRKEWCACRTLPG